tara:strand:+ start:314 stop:760 length:447 start_codon:yes stop_codon:yes gene_type:complete
MVENWKEKINSSPKADTYKSHKNLPKFEKYLDTITNSKHLRSFVKLRLFDHNLMIEKGRRNRPPTPREQRLCPQCKVPGDEIHFLIDCDICVNRTEFFDRVINIVPNFPNLPDSKAKFIFLMTQENDTIIKLIAKYTYEWFKLIENHP